MVQALLDGRKTQTRRRVKAAGSVNRSRSLSGDSLAPNPFGRPGDRLWIKETWSSLPQWDHVKPSKLTDEQLKSVHYHADGKQGGKTRSSLFMPRRASRISLEIIDVRKERLQAIDHADALAEGMAGADAVDDYARLWDQINGKRSWDSNPWVWVVTFRRAL